MFSGGFASNVGGGGFNADTPNSSQERGKGARRGNGLSMVPMLISDLLDCVQSDGSLILEGQEVSSVMLVGLVRSADIQTLNYKYILDDLSGATMQVVQWLETASPDEDDEPPVPPLMTNAYARVCGSVRRTDDNLFLVAFKVSRLTDLNLLTMHLLETVHSRRMARGTTSGSVGNSVGVASFSVGDNLAVNRGGSGAFAGLGPEQQMIAAVIDTFQDEVGCPLDVLLTRVNLPHAKIREALKFMSDEGHLYTTSDEDHYKLTAN